MAAKTKKQEAKKEKNSFSYEKDCPIHGNLKLRGRSFKGKVTKKLQKRVSIEFERMVYVNKYERYKISRTKVHARLPECMADDINVGDYIEVKECRPLSKLIHFCVVGKIKPKKEKKSSSKTKSEKKKK